MSISRRTFLRAALMGGATLALPIGALQFPMRRMLRAQEVTSPPVERFTLPLPIPPVLEPVESDETTDYYEITQREATAELLPGYRTTIWGYNGIFPGPTIEARRGRQVVVRQINALPVPVVTHLHGGVTPPESDGYPTDLILPVSGDGGHGSHGGNRTAGERVYTYPNQQPAATLWYHDHRMDFTGPQVYRGLAGLYIIRDEVEDALPLPRGQREVPLVITDRIFDDDGELFYPSIDDSLTGQPGVLPNFTNGVFGDTVLVNGAAWPVLDVSNTRYRFRILNAANARPYMLALDPPPPNGPAFVQIGSDAGLLTAPVEHEELRVTPAERFDVIVDFSGYPVGTQVVLRNRFDADGATAEVMRFDVVREEQDESRIPVRLVEDDITLHPEDAERTRNFQFLGSILGSMSTVNFKTFDPDRIDAKPRLDSTEIWHFGADPEHPIHLHLAHFKVIERDDREPDPWDVGWKDTVWIPSGGVRVIARFSGYRGKYVFHCHNLEHEDMMMMANFEVI